MDDEMGQMRPASDKLPPTLCSALTKRGRLRAQAGWQVTLRMPPNVLDAVKTGGPGWQTQMSEALSKAANKMRAA